MEQPAKTRDNRPLLKRGPRLTWPGLIAAIAIAIAASLAISFAISLAIGAGRFGQPAHASDVVLLYVGAEDCAPCRAWQKDDRPGFLASAEFPRIRYLEVKSPTLVDVLKDENWPEELRPYRTQLKPSDGVPLWVIVSDDRIVERQFGAAAWREIIVPKLRKLVSG